MLVQRIELPLRRVELGLGRTGPCRRSDGQARDESEHESENGVGQTPRDPWAEGSAQSTHNDGLPRQPGRTLRGRAGHVKRPVLGAPVRIPSVASAPDG